MVYPEGWVLRKAGLGGEGPRSFLTLRQLVLNKADPLFQAALLGQDSGLGFNRGAVGAQLLCGQCARQQLA